AEKCTFPNACINEVVTEVYLSRATVGLNEQSVELQVIREKLVESLLYLHRPLRDSNRVYVVVIVEPTCCLVPVQLAAGIVNVELGRHNLSPPVLHNDSILL